MSPADVNSADVTRADVTRADVNSVGVNSAGVNSAGVARGDPALLKFALAAATRGWHVFPCAPGAKQPALRANWQDLATTSAERIRAWWSRGPYNIGVACGPSGLVVVDLDMSRDSAGAFAAGFLFPLSGADGLARLARSRGQQYPSGTYTVDTPSGGCHLYFAADDGDRVRNSAGALGPLIDIRADGGYVVGAGSRIGGQAYAARGQRSPQPLPAWLGDLLRDDYVPPSVPLVLPFPLTDRVQGRAYAMAALREETARVAAARPGTRNDTLNRAAFSLGQLVAAGLVPPLPVATGLLSAAMHAGLSEDEAVRTIRSGMAGGARKPRAW